ncbi:MAG TPA: M23 family metallopeptidase [bacterium]|nr:M23 family metallopeptidase [bacterium]
MISPVQGTTRARNNGAYGTDSGLDILCDVGTPVVAAAAGTIIYSEYGHTPWGTTYNKGIDTPYSVLVELDRPLEDRGRKYYYHWYTHLKTLAFDIPDGGEGKRIKEGTVLGTVGLGNQVPHLHFGILRDRRQRGPQDWMDPNRVADYVWPDESPHVLGTTANPQPHPPPVMQTIKVFQHGDKIGVVVDGKTYVGLGIKERAANGEMKPWIGSELLIRYRP